MPFFADFPEDMKSLYAYIETGMITNPLTERIEERVQTIKSREDIEMGYWSVNAALQDERYYGEKEGMVNTLISLVKKGRLTVADAAEEAGITEEEFEQKMSRECMAAVKP